MTGITGEPNVILDHRHVNVEEAEDLRKGLMFSEKPLSENLVVSRKKMEQCAVCYWIYLANLSGYTDGLV